MHTPLPFTDLPSQQGAKRAVGKILSLFEHKHEKRAGSQKREEKKEVPPKTK
jgi:hypothetical protein